MFCRWGRTWWMPRGSLACREQRCQLPQGPSSLTPLPWTSHGPTPGLWGHRHPTTTTSYPVAVLQEAGEVAVRGLEANEVRVTLLLH